MTESPRLSVSQTQNSPSPSPGRASKSVRHPTSLTTSKKKEALRLLWCHEALITSSDSTIARWAGAVPWAALAKTGLHTLGLTNHFRSSAEIYTYAQFLALALADYWGLPYPK